MRTPAQVVEAAEWSPAIPMQHTSFRIEAVHVGDPFIELAVHAPTDTVRDGPCVDLTPDQARKIADTLYARADLIQAMGKALSAHLEEVPF